MWIDYKGKLIGVDRETAKKLLSPSKVATTAEVVDTECQNVDADIPKFSFYEKGKFILIGEKGKEFPFPPEKRFLIIHYILTEYILNRRETPISALEASHCNKAALSPEDQQKIEWALNKESFKNISSVKEETNRSIKYFNDRINELIAIYEKCDDLSEKIDIKNEIANINNEIEKVKRERSLAERYKIDPKSPLAKSQKAVRKLIVSGLKALHHELPYIIDYLNIENFKTGYFIKFNPSKSKPAHWILTRES